MKLVQLLERILIEVSFEQLKADFVDSGKLSKKVFDQIVDAAGGKKEVEIKDGKPEEKIVGGKSAYATWLAARVYGKDIEPEDVYKYKDYLAIYNRRKREYESSDIATIKDPQAVQAFVNTSIELLDKENQDKSTAKGVAKQDKYTDFKIGEVDGFTVYELPKGRTDLYGTSCELGSGTEWCTATGKTDEHFLRYITRGPLYIFIKGDEKYQFSFAAKQFMDKYDRPVVVMGDPYKVLPLFEFLHNLKGYSIPARLQEVPKYTEKVFMQFGRIKRGGFGIEGTYEELKSKLTSTSRNNADIVADKLNLTWDRMIIYQVPDYDKMTTLFAIHGTDENGKEYMYDRAGIGGSGYSKIYSSGGTKVNVSNVVIGATTAADFKENLDPETFKDTGKAGRWGSGYKLA